MFLYLYFQISAFHFSKKLCCGHSKLQRAPSDASYDYGLHIVPRKDEYLKMSIKAFLNIFKNSNVMDIH